MKKIHTRNEIKKAAKKIFWEEGLNKTNVEQISDAADISRMTFYREFSSKNELVFEIIGELFEGIINESNRIFEKPIPFIEKVNEVVSYNYTVFKDISQEMLIDLNHQKNPTLKKYIDEHNNRSKSNFFKIIQSEQNKGNIRSDVKVEFISYFMDKAYELMFDPEIKKMYDTSDEVIDAITRMFFFGIVRR